MNLEASNAFRQLSQGNYLTLAPPHPIADPFVEHVDLQDAEALLNTRALQSAIFNSAKFACIATDVNGVIQLFNVGAERMLGYPAVDVVNKITPVELHDPQEVIAHATALSLEYATPIAPGFEALVFKASRGIEDIYELTKVPVFLLVVEVCYRC